MKNYAIRIANQAIPTFLTFFRMGIDAQMAWGLIPDKALALTGNTHKNRPKSACFVGRLLHR